MCVQRENFRFVSFIYKLHKEMSFCRRENGIYHLAPGSFVQAHPLSMHAQIRTSL